MTTPAFAAGERIPLDGFAQILLHCQRPGIYALTDPIRGGCIAYVGQAVSVAQRYMQHVDPENSMGPEKRNWTRALRSAGHVPGLLVLEWCDRRDLTERELAWIKRAKANGCGWLNGPCTPFCGSPDGLIQLLEEIGTVESARSKLRLRQKRPDRAKVATRVYRGILELRAAAQKAEADRKAKEGKAKREEAQARQFERRVQAEVDRRLAAQAGDFEKLQKQFRVRANNASRLGIRSVE